MLSLLVIIFVFSLLPTAALADDGKGKPEKVEKTTGLDRAAEAKAKAEESPASETEPEVAPKPPVVKAPEAPKPKNDKGDGDNISIPTPVKPGKGEPTLGEPPVLEPDDPIRVNINPDHVGTTADCAADWHFVLVGLGKGASPARLTAVFEKAGEIVVDPSKINQQMQHFNIVLPVGDKLVEAFAQVMLPGLSEHVRLNLSSVTCVTPPPPPPPPPPPSEEPTCPPPPTKPEKPVTPKPEPKPEYTLIVKPVEEPYLPYTGGNYVLFLGLSTILGSAGLGLRRLGGTF